MKTYITTLILAAVLVIPQATYASQVQGTLTATVSDFPALSVGGLGVNGSDAGTTTSSTTEETVPAPAPARNNGGGGGGGGSNNSANLKGDANKDGRVDILDFVLVMAQWNKNTSPLSADFNADGKVDILDFVTLMAAWTK